jgi:hypothetical protein
VSVPPRISVTKATSFVEAASVTIENRDGWLLVDVKAEPEIIGYAVVVNGRDLPAAPLSDGEDT